MSSAERSGSSSTLLPSLLLELRSVPEEKHQAYKYKFCTSSEAVHPATINYLVYCFAGALGCAGSQDRDSPIAVEIMCRVTICHMQTLYLKLFPVGLEPKKFPAAGELLGSYSCSLIIN